MWIPAGTKNGCRRSWSSVVGEHCRIDRTDSTVDGYRLLLHRPPWHLRVVGQPAEFRTGMLDLVLQREDGSCELVAACSELGGDDRDMKVCSWAAWLAHRRLASLELAIRCTPVDRASARMGVCV